MSATLPLPRNLVINNVVNVQHWRDANFAIYQNYSLPRATSNQPLQDRTPGILGTNLYHLYRIVNFAGAEALGEEVASYSSLDPAITRASQG